MTPEQLAAIKARRAKATGDQIRNGRRWMARELGKRYQVCTRDLRHVVFADSWDDANFIAEAHADVPALVAEVERLWTENDRLRQDRYDALTVKTREGLLASEWIARTGRAERERDAACKEVERLRRVEAAAKAVDASWAESWDCSAHPQHGKHFEAIGNLSAALRAAESGE